MLFNDSLSSYCLALHNKPMFLESLFSTVLICPFHEIFSSNITPKNLIEVWLFKTLLTIFKSGKTYNFKGSSSLVLFL